ncbi:MerR family transcriptional regulator [Nocardia sp. KC 131]|uniref:MerR family transcriptional regulator n=1 Tax=Nocardia arseniciresistens TaxID=3392119 RepID=UPI00398F0FD0
MTDDTWHRGLVSIGELSQLTGVSVRTVRFYCDNGILESQRTTGGHRVFDPTTTVDRLLLVRRLRALGVGLAAIVAVLTGEQTIAEAVAVERAAVDVEFRAMAWRRASLRAVEAAAPSERAHRLELLAAVQSGHAAHDAVVRFWRRILTPLPADMFDGFVAMNVPELPTDPTPEQVVGYAELVRYVADSAFNTVVSQQIWHSNRTVVRDKVALLVGVAEACTMAEPFIGTDADPGHVLDRFVEAHASARGERDTPRFRERLLADLPADNRRIHRYWRITGEITGAPTTGNAQRWLYDALHRSTSAVV